MKFEQLLKKLKDLYKNKNKNKKCKWKIERFEKTNKNNKKNAPL